MSRNIAASDTGASGFARLRRYRSKRRTHQLPEAATLPPDDPPASDGTSSTSTLETVGAGHKVLTFEAWMGGAGLLGDD